VKTEASAVTETAPPSEPSTLAPAVTEAAPPSTEAVAETTATTAVKSKTTTAPSRLTTETKPAQPRPTAPPTTAAPANEETGGASWYDYNTGECAHLTIPKGTVVTVTRIDTGVSVTCVVTDRGPFGSGRIIDLDRTTFARLASPEAGVIQVRLTW
jgi:rare lipoprotein A (peptidoglycan hydrolase)